MAQLPSVGRIVHYVNCWKSHRPAIISQINEADIELVVFDRNGGTSEITVDPIPCDTHESGTWHWPEYVGEDTRVKIVGVRENTREAQTARDGTEAVQEGASI